MKAYDLALIAKPTGAFSDAEKYMMDQYVNGGKSTWPVDQDNIDSTAFSMNREQPWPYPEI